jgi:hypothetical protein
VIGAALLITLIMGCLPSKMRTGEQIVGFVSSNGPIEAFAYAMTGMPEHVEVPPDSTFMVELKDWLLAHQEGWKQSFETYAPHYLVKGKGFTLNIRSDAIVLNYEAKVGNWRQVVRPADTAIENKTRAFFLSVTK